MVQTLEIAWDSLSTQISFKLSYRYTGISISELFGYRDTPPLVIRYPTNFIPTSSDTDSSYPISDTETPFSDSLSELVWISRPPPLFGYLDPSVYRRTEFFTLDQTKCDNINRMITKNGDFYFEAIGAKAKSCSSLKPNHQNMTLPKLVLSKSIYPCILCLFYCNNADVLKASQIVKYINNLNYLLHHWTKKDFSIPSELTVKLPRRLKF